jgi:Zn finger protein HypA/HybF involved in hydrogenase expression
MSIEKKEINNRAKCENCEFVSTVEHFKEALYEHSSMMPTKPANSCPKCGSMAYRIVENTQR